MQSSLRRVLSAAALAVFTFPTLAQTTQLVSYAVGGAQRDHASAHPALNGDGSLVAFDGTIPLGGGGFTHSFLLHDLASGMTVNPLPGANGGSFSPQFAPNGPYVVFHSGAINLDPGDIYADSDIYILHLANGHVEWLSIAHDGSNPVGQAQYPQVSDDGTQIVFEAPSYGLTPEPDTNPWSEIFVRNRTSGTTVLISRSMTGTTGDGSSTFPDISADGRYVTFASDSSDLVPGDTNGRGDIFVCDRDADENGIFDDSPQVMVRVSVADNGDEANNNCNMPSISGDGRYVAFDSAATSLIANDTGMPGYRIFVHDRDADNDGTFDEPGETRTTLESRNSLGDQTNMSSKMARLSEDGRKLAFYSTATDIVANSCFFQCVYLRDLDTRQTRLVSVDSEGTYPNHGSGLNYWSDGGTAISGDGKRVAFYSAASNLVASDTNNLEDIFVHTPAEDPGIDLGYYLEGSNGKPVLHLQGPMRGGQATDLWLRFGPSSQLAYLMVSDAFAPLPFRDGTIVPAFGNHSFFGPFLTDVDGRFDLSITPAPALAGLTVYAQWLAFDPALPQGIGMSNGLEFVIQP